MKDFLHCWKSQHMFLSILLCGAWLLHPILLHRASNYWFIPMLKGLHIPISIDWVGCVTIFISKSAQNAFRERINLMQSLDLKLGFLASLFYQHFMLFIYHGYCGQVITFWINNMLDGLKEHKGFFVHLFFLHYQRTSTSIE